MAHTARMKFTFLMGLLSLAILAGCNSRAADPPPEEKIASHEPRGEFRSRSYTISEREHVVIFDVPDRLFPMRCWVFTDDKTGTSHMQCDDEGGLSLPNQGSELER
jgi:hypothetical protein